MEARNVTQTLFAAPGGPGAPAGCRHLARKGGDRLRHRLARLLFLLLFLAAPTLALAHAQLIASQPADGSVVAAPPATLTLTFNEPVSPITVKLARPDGGVSLIEDVKTDGAALRVTAPAGLANGSYALSYRVISEDGHPVGGSVLFAIGSASSGARPVAQDTTPVTSRWLILGQRTLLYLGLFLGIGGVFARHWFGRGEGEGVAVLRLVLAAGLAAALLGIGLQGLDMLAVSPSALFSPAPWHQGLGTSYALTLAVSALAIIIALLAEWAAGRLARALSLAALVLTGIAVAVSGHASAADPQWLMRPAVCLHIVSVTIWAGALFPLFIALRRNGPEAAAMLTRFSRAILPVVAVLVVTGVALAAVQVRTVPALWTTAYGTILLVKLGLLELLFAAAAANRLWWTAPALEAMTSIPENTAPASRLRRSIAIEILLVLAILATVANWRFTAPPRALQLAARQAVAAEVMSDKAMAEVSIFPNTTGPVTVTVTPMAHGAGDLSVKELSVILSNPAAGIEPIRRKAAMTDDGDYAASGFTLPVPGTWHVRVEILISDFEMTAPEGDVAISR
jgi:copper transport protein